MFNLIFFKKLKFNLIFFNYFNCFLLKKSKKGKNSLKKVKN